MSHFIFKAKKPSGEIYAGQKDLVDRYELYKVLRESGDELVSLKEKKSMQGLNRSITFNILGEHVKMVEKINLTRNLGAMLEAGLPLSRALAVLERQTHNKVLQSILTDLSAAISKGSTFADALARHPKVFQPLFVSMVHVGEQSGALDDSLKALSNQMDSSYSLERRIRGAMMYPGVIVSAMVSIGILMFIFVVPTLVKTFTDLKVQLPLTTRIVFGVSTVIQHQGIWLLLGAIIIFCGIRWWSKTPPGKFFFHGAYLKIPVVGVLVQEVNTARTARTLSSLLSAGVEVVEALDITSTVVQNVHFRAILLKATDAIKRGDLMSKIFEEHAGMYPAFFSEMMGVGEETGKTGEMLLDVAKYYEDEVDHKTKDMSAIIEPVLILIIGAAVGFFALSMISPIYSLVSAM